VGTADNVIIGVTGKAYVAVVGTPFPADPFTAWATPWVDLGYISTDGLDESLGENRTEIDAWGENSPVITRVKNRQQTFKLTFLETTAATLQLYYAVKASDMNASGAGTGAFVTYGSASTTTAYTTALGLDVVMDNKIERIMIARADVTNRGDRKFNANAEASMEMTFTALTNPSGGKSVNRYNNGITLS
jgi:hypothetical protein